MANDDYVSICGEIGIFNNNSTVVTAVDTERLIGFINKYGVNFTNNLGHHIIVRLDDFIDIMTVEQMRIFFSYKPDMIHKSRKQEEGHYPLIPITFRNYEKSIDIINTILECCDTHPQFIMWRKLVKIELTHHFTAIKRFTLLEHIMLLLDNHEKLSTRFFDIMRVKLVK